MKQIKRLMLGLFLMVAQMAWSQGGIDFFHGSFAEAQDKADETGKLIFMDGFATWCGPCKYMSANTFTDSQVGDLYNTFFVNMKVDMEKGEGPRLARMYRVRAYPTLFIMDSGGQVLEKMEGAMGPEQMFNWAIAAISKHAPELFDKQDALRNGTPEEVAPEIIPEEPQKDTREDDGRYDEVIAEAFEEGSAERASLDRDLLERTRKTQPATTRKPSPQKSPQKTPLVKKEPNVKVKKPAPATKKSSSSSSSSSKKSATSGIQKPAKTTSATDAKKEIKASGTSKAAKSGTSTEEPKSPNIGAANAPKKDVDKSHALEHNLPLYNHHPLEGVEEKLIEAITAKDRAKMMKLSHQLLEVDDMERKMLFVEAWRAWALATDDVASMVINISEMLDQTDKKSALLLNNAAWYVFELTDDDDALELAAKWAEESIKMEPEYYNHDTFAHLMFVAGEMALAREYGKKSVSMAKEQGLDASGTLELLAQIPD